MWSRIISFQKAYGRVVEYDLRGMQVHPISELDIPWHAALVVGSFHRKHVFLDKRLPDLRSIAADLTAFGNRVKWAWHYQDEVAPSYIRLVKRDPCPYVGVIPPE